VGIRHRVPKDGGTRGCPEHFSSSVVHLALDNNCNCTAFCAGFPSVGKSSLLTLLTGTESEAAAYEFTTLTCIPGVIHYNDAKIQLLDLPGIIEGAAEGKGRGRQVGGRLGAG
jgi:ribosome-interacting GTPase 1